MPTDHGFAGAIPSLSDRFRLRWTEPDLRPDRKENDVRSLPLITARLLLAAWVGAAVLFVITGVREVTTKEPNLAKSPVKDALVTVRFPAYYAFGFMAVGIGLLATAASGKLIPRGRQLTLIALLVVALLMMAADYVWVYQPLVEMVTPPGKAKPANFVTLHDASKWINMADVFLVFVAAVLICRPISKTENSRLSESDVN